jgi:hypothetical protein
VELCFLCWAANLLLQQFQLNTWLLLAAGEVEITQPEVVALVDY